eukprot:gene42831-53144_t
MNQVNAGAVIESSVQQHIRSAADTTVTLDILSDNSHTALIAAVANVLGLSMDAVSVVTEELISTTSGLSTVGVTVRVLAQNSDFSTETYDSPAELFAFVQTSMSASLSSTAFNTALHTAAVHYQSAELVDSAYDSSVTVDQPTYSGVETVSNDDNLSKGDTAGIVIGVIVVVALAVALIFYAVSKRPRSEQQTHAPVPTSQV